MKKYVKIIILIVSHLFVFGVGYFGALWYEEDRLTKLYLSNSMAILSRYRILADMQRAFGTNEGYRDALLVLLKAMDKARTPNDLFFTEDICQREASVVYGRLALIEKKSGDLNKSKEYFNKAMESCAKGGLTDCSPEKLVWFIGELDKRSIVNPPLKQDKN